MPDPALLRSFERALAAHGLSRAGLERGSTAIALFGSRADGCERPSSDWDLLCIGNGRSRKLDDLDLVWVGSHEAAGEAWLSGDLAGHVAVHGVWLHGVPSWRLADVRFDAAASSKERKLACRLRSLTQAWDLLGPAYQHKHATRLRRDVQRLDLLHRRVAVPPTAHLDACWRASQASDDRLRETLLLLGAEASLASAIVERAGGRSSR
jgi:hypothetical protein